MLFYMCKLAIIDLSIIQGCSRTFVVCFLLSFCYFSLQVSGKFSAIYDAYYKQIDPKGTGSIEAMLAAKFLKKSGLSDVVLSRIWDLSDPTGRGFLDRQGLFVALKLVALAQAGNDINMGNINLETSNPPKVVRIENMDKIYRFNIVLFRVTFQK